MAKRKLRGGANSVTVFRSSSRHGDIEMNQVASGTPLGGGLT